MFDLLTGQYKFKIFQHHAVNLETIYIFFTFLQISGLREEKAGRELEF